MVILEWQKAKRSLYLWAAIPPSPQIQKEASSFWSPPTCLPPIQGDYTLPTGLLSRRPATLSRLTETFSGGRGFPELCKSSSLQEPHLVVLHLHVFVAKSLVLTWPIRGKTCQVSSLEFLKAWALSESSCPSIPSTLDLTGRRTGNGS